MPCSEQEPSELGHEWKGREKQREEKGHEGESIFHLQPPLRDTPLPVPCWALSLLDCLSPKLEASCPHFTDKRTETQADVLTCSRSNTTQALSSCRPAVPVPLLPAQPVALNQAHVQNSSTTRVRSSLQKTPPSFLQIDPWWGQPIRILSIPEPKLGRLIQTLSPPSPPSRQPGLLGSASCQGVSGLARPRCPGNRGSN